MRLVDFKQDNCLYQIVREQTRGDNLLDLIFSTEEDLISEVEVGEALAGSDQTTLSNTWWVYHPIRRSIGPAKKKMEPEESRLRQLPSGSV